VRIRPAEPADARAIAEIVERAYGGYVERIGLRPGPMDDDYAE
jgi:3'-phosphoadenosine 5'-phosphosulfate sulfotransferase